MRFLIILALSVCSMNPALAGGRVKAATNPRFISNRGPGPFNCDNGRSYELRGNTIYVDGIPALNGVYYELWGYFPDNAISLRENGFVSGRCQLANPPPPPAPPTRWDNYVKVCDPHCRWESHPVR